MQAIDLVDDQLAGIEVCWSLVTVPFNSSFLEIDLLQLQQP
jgi:hypothetical protein